MANNTPAVATPKSTAQALDEAPTTNQPTVALSQAARNQVRELISQGSKFNKQIGVVPETPSPATTNGSPAKTLSAPQQPATAPAAQRRVPGGGRTFQK